MNASSRLVLLILLTSPPFLPPSSVAAQEYAYEDHNQVTPRPLAVCRVGGRAIDPSGNAVPNVRLGLFQGSEPRLVQVIVADSKGCFNLPGVPAGEYRLVVKYEGFCPANVPIVVPHCSPCQGEPKENLVIHMNVYATDGCSYGTLEAQSSRRRCAVLVNN